MAADNRMTFVELLTNNTILFPKIQRDYAQGRKKEKELRVEFLKALFDYMHSDDPEHDLDFIYGTRKDRVFIPLDGQQRLTTLFLLHWYLGTKFNQQQWFEHVFDDNQETKFSYQTRPSSTSFCKELAKFNALNNPLVSDKDQNNSISKTIKNQGWFFSSWINDPTIKSMLTMIDEIHGLFDNVTDICFDRLFNKRWITFQMLYLDDFKLTDDLYIKMNARGVPLTSFETFKAKLEQRIKNSFNEIDITDRYVGSEKVYLHEYFAYMIDTKWADLFWNYKSSKFIFDSKLMNFIRVIWSSQYALNNPKEPNLELLFDTEAAKRLEAYSEVVTFNYYNNLGVITYDAVSFLISSLNALSNGVKKIKTYNIDSYYFDQDKIFEKVLDHNLTHLERVRFFAYISFLVKLKKNDDTVNEDELWQWMRIVYNLTENTPLDSASRCSSAIQSIYKMLDAIPQVEDKCILDYIIDNKIDFFSEVQVKEEKIKAILIKKSAIWSSSIYELEKHPYFKGQIGFVFDFSAISDLYADNNLQFNNNDEENDYYNNFCMYAAKISSLFSAIIADNSKIISECLLERALLTKGDYLLVASSNRKNFANRIYHRDYSWKRYLRYDEDNITQRNYFKQLIDDPYFINESVESSLGNIITDSIINDWRGYFINCKELIKECHQGFIRYINDDDIILLGQSQMNHWHCEMYTKHLWYNDLGKNTSTINLFTPEYSWSKSSDEESYIFCKFKYLKKEYEIGIYYYEGLYKLRFCKTKGSTSEKDYHIELLKLFTEGGFKLSDNGYYKAIKSQVAVKKVIETLSDEILKL